MCCLERKRSFARSLSFALSYVLYFFRSLHSLLRFNSHLAQQGSTLSREIDRVHAHRQHSSAILVVVLLDFALQLEREGFKERLLEDIFKLIVIVLSKLVHFIRGVAEQLLAVVVEHS